jgi:predicted RNA-binding protein with PIN domain
MVRVSAITLVIGVSSRTLSQVARILVDGNNVMGTGPDGWWRDREGAMQRLVNALDDYAQASGDEIAVVFDGRERDLQAVRVGVDFAPDADDAIASRAEPGLTVVTSDAELAGRVRSRGADVIGSSGFRRRLDEGGLGG